jgi:hypothetical protein
MQTNLPARPGWGALCGLMLVVLTVLAGVEASQVAEGVRTSLAFAVVLAGFAVTKLWVHRNRAALDLQEWCACAGEKVTVRLIHSHPATWPRLAPAEPLRVGLAEQIEDPGELVSAGGGASMRPADLRRD